MKRRLFVAHAISAAVGLSLGRPTRVLADALFVTRMPPSDPYEGYAPLYVNGATGSDSRTKAQARNPGTPWATIGRAAWGSTDRASPNSSEAAASGDIVRVAPGTYDTTTATGENYDPIYNPTNEGSSGDGNAIVFLADGAVTLESSTAGDGEPIIGAYQKDYIIWDGFYLDETNINTTADKGPVVLQATTGSEVRNLDVDCITSSWNDNHNAVRLETATNCRIYNCELSGARNSGGNRNGSAITFYTSTGCIVEHCDISDSGCGIFIKGANTGGNTVRYNLLYNMDGDALCFGGVTTSAADPDTLIYQNICRDSAAGIYEISYSENDPKNVYVVNNVVHNCTTPIGGFSAQATGEEGLVYQNNIFVAGDYRCNFERPVSVVTDGFAFDYNMYWDQINPFWRVDYTNYTLAEWRSTFGHGANSSVEDPVFVDEANNDFRLDVGSPALNNGVDILNLQGQGTSAPINQGAYVTGNESIGME